ncbi:MAG: PHP domain-containing protein [Desulfovermiculus sp.]|nr:PHP domain-containing protein [Desulfovermiculus sp.]
MIFDLHVHSNISPCSDLTLEDIVHQAREKGLDGVCITDHDTMAAGQLVAEGVQDNGLVVIIGQEYTTRQGDFLLFGPYEDLPLGLRAEKVLNHVRANGGVAIGAHPFRKGRSMDPALIRSGLCPIIEQENGRNTALENAQTQTWLTRYPLIPVAGSDAHSLEELGRLPFRFPSSIHSRMDLISALNSGQGIPVPTATESFSSALASCA